MLKPSTLLLLSAAIFYSSNAAKPVSSSLPSDLHAYLTSPSVQAQLLGSLPHDPVVSELRSALPDFRAGASSLVSDDGWSSLSEKAAALGGKLLDCSSKVVETLKCLDSSALQYVLQTCHGDSVAMVTGTADAQQWCKDINNVVVRTAQGLQEQHTVHVAESAWNNVTTWVAMDMLKYAAAHKLAEDVPLNKPITLVAMEDTPTPPPAAP